MAQRTTVALVDDIDGGQADETVSFDLDGVDYTIDLSADHARELRDIMAPYVAVATRTGGRRQTKPKALKPVPSFRAEQPRPSREHQERVRKVREYAKAQGLGVGDKGRIPKHIFELYDHDHQPPPDPAPKRQRRTRTAASRG